MDAKLDLDKLHVKDAGKLMLNSFDEMYEYLKEKGEFERKRIVW